MNDSYVAGLEVLACAGIGEHELRNRAAEVDADFVRQTIEFTYGEIFARPGLNLKLRMFAAIAAQATAGNSPDQLRELVRAALNLGWTKIQLIEVIIQTCASSGTHATLKALAECHDLLVDMKDCNQAACSESPDIGHE